MRRSTAKATHALIGALLLPVLAAAPAAAASSVPAPSAASAQPRVAASAVSPELAAARKTAAALQAKVAALEVATELAVEHYNEVMADLKVARVRHAAATRTWQAARASQIRADRIADQRLRDIYISGGPPGLLDLTIGTPPGMDPFHSFDDARFFLAGDRQRFAAAAAAAATAAAAERVQAGTLASQERLTREAAASKAAVHRKLAAEQKLLASASAEVRAVLAAEQRAEQQAAAALAAVVQSARRKAGSAGVALSATTVTPFYKRVLAAAETELGKPYRWGATGPDSFDCSGLVQEVFAAAGVSLPRTSRQQWYSGPHPRTADLQPGDLLFWANGSDPATIHHVAIYLGAGYMIAAPHTGTVVQVQPVYDQGYFDATRVSAPTGR